MKGNEKILKIGLAILLFLCLLDMPYGYYQLVRTVSMIVFAILGYTELEHENQNMAFVYFGLAILFQPIIKISLGRELWNVVDLVVGIWLVYSALNVDPKSNKRQSK